MLSCTSTCTVAVNRRCTNSNLPPPPQPRPSPSPRLEPFSALQSTAVSQPVRRNGPTCTIHHCQKRGLQPQTPAAAEKAWLAATANAIAAYCTPMGAIHRKASKSLAAGLPLKGGSSWAEPEREKSERGKRHHQFAKAMGGETNARAVQLIGIMGCLCFLHCAPSSSYRSANRGQSLLFTSTCQYEYRAGGRDFVFLH